MTGKSWSGTASRVALALGLMAAAHVARAQEAPPQLVVGSQGPIILGPDGRPYTQNIGNGTQSLRATVTASERGLNIVFTRLTDVDPNFFPLAQIHDASGLRVFGSVTARYGFEVGDVGGASQQENQSTTDVFGGSAAYRLFETTNTITVNVGGGITANVRAGGVQLASATAPDAASAQAMALSSSGELALPGRRLPPIVTNSGVTQSVSETRVSAITARDTYVVTIVTFGPDTILVGKRGQCDQFLTNCQGGMTYRVGVDETNFNTFFLEDVYVTNTLTRTVTSTGTITLDIPFAAYGRAHPGAQTVGFDLSSRFLARILRGGDARLGAGIGADGGATMFLEGTAMGGDYGADGAIAASSATSEGVRGGIAFRPSADLVLGLAGEAGRWRWALADRDLPESARDGFWRAGGFAAWSPGAWRVNAAAFGGRQRVGSTASSTLGGGTSTARYDAGVWGAGVEIGRALPAGRFTVTPSLGLDWLGWRAPAFRESGGLAPLAVASAARDQWRGHAGLAADYRGGRLGLGAYARGTATGGDRQGLVVASDGVSAPGNFTIAGAASDRAAAEMGAHLDYEPTPGVVFTLSGDARIGTRSTQYGGQIGLRVTL